MRCVFVCFLFLFTASAWAATTTTETRLEGVSASDYFGTSVAVSNTTLVIGAPYATVDRVGDAGVVYIYGRSTSLPATWQLKQTIVANDASSGDLFGSTVAIDGNRIVVGAPGFDTGPTNTDGGAVYVFELQGKVWNQVQRLNGTGNDSGFGYAVSLNGNTLAVGSQFDDGTFSNQGSVSVYIAPASTFSLQQKLTLSSAAANDTFGRSVSVSANTLAVGVPFREAGANTNAGAVAIFTRSGTTWTQQQLLTASDNAPSDYLGLSVSLDGDYLVAGAYGDDTGTDNSRGSAYVFFRAATTFAQQAKLLASDGVASDFFGYSVAISGSEIAVGAYGADTVLLSGRGAVYKYIRNGTTWPQTQKLLASNPAASDGLGRSVSITQGVIAAGAPTATVSGNTYRGFAVVLEPALVSITSVDTNAVEQPTDTATFQITRSGSTTAALTVTFSSTTGAGFATVGSDYTLGGTASATTATIPAGASFVNLTVSPINDSLMEGPESVRLTIVDGAEYNLGPKTIATVSIADDDQPAPTVTITANSPNAGEPATTGAFTITRSTVTASPLDVFFNTSGTAEPGDDYTALPTFVTILANQASVVVPVAVVDDTAFEPAETVIVSLEVGPGYDLGAPVTQTATVTISSNETAPEITNVSPETSTFAEFTLTVTGSGFAPDAQIQLNGLPVDVTNFVNPTTLTALINPASEGPMNIPGIAPAQAGVAGRVAVTVRNMTAGITSNEKHVKIYSGASIGEWLVTTTVDNVNAAGSLRLAMQEVLSGEFIRFSPTVFGLDKSESSTTININGDPLSLLDKGNVTIDASNRRVRIDGTEGKDGLVVVSDGNVVKGLTVTSFDNGIVVQSCSNNLFGGNRLTGNDTQLSGNGEGLRLSRNNDTGLVITGALATNNVVKGAWIGLGPQGTTSLANGTGVRIDLGASNNTLGSTVAGEGNVISGNDADGIDINTASTNNNKIIGNLIGTDKNGTGDLGNSSHGIFIENGPQANTVGGLPANNEGNIIAFNKGFGVVVKDAQSVKNAVRGNRIFKNSLGGISLESGGNNNIGSPQIDSVTRSGSFSLTAALSRDGDEVSFIGRTSAPAGSVELFNDSGAQGGEVLGRATVTNGEWAFETTSADITQSFTATFTDEEGNTSVFSVFGGSFVDDYDGDGVANVDDLDDDNDGFSDIFEVAAGTSPFSETAVPGGGGGGAVPALNIAKASLKLTFNKTNADSISLSGTLPAALGTVVTGKKAVVDVGGLVLEMTTGSTSLKLSKPSKKNESKYSLKLSKTNLQTTLADEGFTNSTITTATTPTLKVMLFIDGIGGFGSVVTFKYKAKQGKTGSAKK